MDSNLKRMQDQTRKEPGVASRETGSSEQEERAASFSRGMAHAIRNPLSILQMGVDYLNNVDALDEQGKAVLRDMKDAIGRMDLVIQDLQNYSRTEALQLQPGSIRRVIEQALAVKQPELDAHQIEVKTRFSEENAELLIDEQQILQVLVNILDNSTQAMPDGGELSISTRNDQGFRIEISDTGTGIEEKYFHQVFDPFFTTQTSGSNAGLGLSSSRNVVRLHGGSMELENLPGGGVCVILNFETDKRQDT